MDLEKLQADVISRIRIYEVALMSGHNLLGSGTFVSIDGHCGILTARHVFYKNDRLREPFFSDRKAELSIAYTRDLPHNLKLSFQHLVLVGTDDWLNDEWGPDLLFISIPEMPKLETLRASKSFYPIDLSPPKEQLEIIEKKEGCTWCLVGHADTEKHEISSSHGFDIVYAIPTKVAFGKHLTEHRRDDWDYLELPVESQHPDIPESFGGFSGGGYWKIPLVIENNQVKSIGTPLLMGVAYLEINRDAPGRFLRIHGPYSIYLTFRPRVQIHLQRKKN